MVVNLKSYYFLTVSVTGALKHTVKLVFIIGANFAGLNGLIQLKELNQIITSQ